MKKILLLFLCACFIGAGCTARETPSASSPTPVQIVESSSAPVESPIDSPAPTQSTAPTATMPNGLLTVRTFSIGQADCILLTAGETTVMIDTGEKDDGKDIVSFLQAAGIDTIDLLLITHYDKDHVGGAPKILEAVKVKQLLLPDYPTDSKKYQKMMEAVVNTATPYEYITADRTVAIGDLTLSIRIPRGQFDTAAEDYDNEMSLAAMLTYGNTRFFFAGDAEAIRLAELLSEGDLSCDVLKMPHHGRYSENLAELLDACAPAYAILTDSEKNPAEDSVNALLQERNIAALHTAISDVLLVSDGKAVTPG